MEKYIICVSSYEIDGLRFDKGYIEKEMGRPILDFKNWRYATDDEIAEWNNTPCKQRPNGRYYNYEKE